MHQITCLFVLINQHQIKIRMERDHPSYYMSHISENINRDNQKYFDNTACILQILQCMFQIFELPLLWEMKVHNLIVFFDDWAFPNPIKIFLIGLESVPNPWELPWEFHRQQVGWLEWEEFGSIQSFWSFRGHAAHYRDDRAKQSIQFYFHACIFKPFANFPRWYFSNERYWIE